MAQFAPGQSNQTIIAPASELERAPRAVVRFGTSPDGLPWLVEVDRSQRLEQLFRTVLGVFELSDPDDLPERVRTALEDDVAAGLMGVHQAVLDSGGDPSLVYVSRRKLKRLLGPTILSQILEPPKPEPEQAPMDRSAATNVGAMAVREQDIELVEAVERSIEERQSKRHLVVVLQDGQAWSGSVRHEDRALRTPRAPFRPLGVESLDRLSAEVRIMVWGSGEWRVPLADREQYQAALLRLAQSGQGGDVSFEVPRVELLKAMVEVARDLAKLHHKGVVHGDVAPGNVLLCSSGPISFDSLDLPAGTPATAATFDWAAPEQIVGRPVDPRADVFALGKMATALVGGVPFGEETNYLVPIGGTEARRVRLLKCEGVFVDILNTEHSRAWQLVWQEILGSCVAHDIERRPADAGQLADALAEALETHPPTGTVTCPGQFGWPTQMEMSGSWTFARRVVD